MFKITLFILNLYISLFILSIAAINIQQSDKNEKQDINSVTQALDEDIFGDVDKNQYN